VPAYEKLLRMNSGGTLAKYISDQGAAALNALFSERGGVTLGDIVKSSAPLNSDLNNNKNLALDTLLRSRLGADYDRHCIKLRDKNAELFLEWADLVGFLHFAVYTNTQKDGFGESTKAIGGTDRVLSCAPHAAFVSKNRYGIVNDIPIPDPQTGWANLYSAIKGA